MVDLVVLPAWGEIEADYRAGIKTLRVIAEEHGLTHGAINKRARRDGWDRDLSAKIKARTVLLDSELDEYENSGYIYVLCIDGPTRYYKIGMAKSFGARFSSHQCASPFQLIVACVFFVENMRFEERVLHTMFKEKRVRGEWFALNRDDLREIASRSLLVDW